MGWAGVEWIEGNRLCDGFDGESTRLRDGFSQKSGYSVVVCELMKCARAGEGEEKWKS